MNDPIADMLTRIRNTQSVAREDVFIPFSKLKLRMAEILKAEGYVLDVEKQESSTGFKLRVLLKYKDGSGVITELKRISKPGRRIYVKRSDIPRVLQGMGISIVSTSKGLMTDKEARQQKLGGEILCEIW